MTAWETLVAAGLPDGPIRPPPSGTIDRLAVAAAVRELTSELALLPEHRRELLLAWLGAFEHHWPETFSATFGELGGRAVEALRTSPHDANRYLKLRRIAIANLSHLL